MHSARAIANCFLEIAQKEGKQLTNMQLQKLVYFAHGWHLALTGEPLLTDAVKAWTFGPVIPPLYNSLKMFGNGLVTEPIKRKNLDTGEIAVVEEPLTDYEKRLLQRVWQVYGNMTGSEMSYLTHQPGTPWETTWNQEKFSVIPDHLIKEHFLLLKAQKNGQQ
jgi:uncharacterized phage-associated protein